MATVFLNPRWRRPPSLIFTNMHFRCHRYVPNRSLNVSTICGDDGSNTKEISAVFRYPAAVILKSTLPVEPPSRHMNSFFVIFNQKFNFYWDILTFEGSLLAGALIRVSDRPYKLDVVTYSLNTLDVHICMQYTKKVQAECDYDCYERLKLAQRFVIGNTELLIYVRSNGNTICSNFPRVQRTMTLISFVLLCTRNNNSSNTFRSVASHFISHVALYCSFADMWLEIKTMQLVIMSC